MGVVVCVHCRAWPTCEPALQLLLAEPHGAALAKKAKHKRRLKKCGGFFRITPTWAQYRTTAIHTVHSTLHSPLGTQPSALILSPRLSGLNTQPSRRPPWQPPLSPVRRQI